MEMSELFQFLENPNPKCPISFPFLNSFLIELKREEITISELVTDLSAKIVLYSRVLQHRIL